MTPEQWEAVQEQGTLLDRVADLFVITEGAKPPGTATTIIGHIREVDGKKMELRCSWESVKNHDTYRYKENSKK